MQKRAINNENDFNIKSGRIEQACARYGLGRNTTFSWGVPRFKRAEC